MATTKHEHSRLFDPVILGDVPLANRVALAPMTRVSATYTGEATEAMAEYYGRFALGGVRTPHYRRRLHRHQLQSRQPIPARTGAAATHLLLEEGNQKGSCQRRKNVRPADARRPAIPGQPV